MELSAVPGTSGSGHRDNQDSIQTEDGSLHNRKAIARLLKILNTGNSTPETLTLPSPPFPPPPPLSTANGYEDEPISYEVPHDAAYQTLTTMLDETSSILKSELQRCQTTSSKQRKELQVKDIEIVKLKRRIATLEAEADVRKAEPKMPMNYRWLDEKLKMFELKLEETSKENQDLKQDMGREVNKRRRVEDILKDVYQSIIDLRLGFGNLVDQMKSSTLWDTITEEEPDHHLEDRMSQLVQQLEASEDPEYDLGPCHEQIQEELKAMKLILRKFSSLTTHQHESHFFNESDHPSPLALSPTNAGTLPEEIPPEHQTLQDLKVLSSPATASVPESTTNSNAQHEEFALSEPVVVKIMKVSTPPASPNLTPNVKLSKAQRRFKPAVAGVLVVTSKSTSSLPSTSSSAQTSSKGKKPGDSVKECKTTVHMVDESRSKEGFFCVCNLKFRTKDHLQHHIKYFSAEKRFPCKFGCGKSFIGASYLKKHVQTKHKVKLPSTIGCRNCGEFFPSRLALVKHRKLFHTIQPENVDVEEPSFSSTPFTSTASTSAGTESFAIPVKTVPFPSPINSAPVSVPESANTQEIAAATVEGEMDKENVAPPTPDENAANEGSSLQFAEELIQMAGCGSATMQKAHREDMSKRHLGAYCICGQLCASRNALHHHFWYRNYQHKLECTICHATYPGFSYLNKHMYGAHKMVPVIPATEDCGENLLGNIKSEPSLPEYRLERMDQHGVDDSKQDGSFSCICGLTFAAGKGLDAHIRHFRAKFVCKTCGRRFVAVSYLKKHMFRKHKIIPKSTFRGCRDCGLTFETSWEHLQHRRIFHKRRGLLRRSNAKSIRPEERHGFVEFVDLEPASSTSRPVVFGEYSARTSPPLYHCKCGKRFSFEKTLMKHIQSHYNGKIFKCDWCPRRFANHQSLKSHVRNMHKQVQYTKRYGCRQCGKTFFTQSQLQYHNRVEVDHRDTQSFLTSFPSSSQQTAFPNPKGQIVHVTL